MPTAYEIYQTYLKGLAALIRLFEQTLGTAAIYGTPPPDFQQRTIESQAQEIDRLKLQIARLRTELSELRHHHFRLSRRNSELEALISKDSHNSRVVHPHWTCLDAGMICRSIWHTTRASGTRLDRRWFM